MVLLIQGVEPDWDKARTKAGADAGHKAIKTRVRNGYLYESGLSDDKSLPATGLEEYS